ncbi:hypothetical protein [Hydrogenovibrio marinus]|uniref:Uncharacterized protein n=1 Tax=Hydrogenovibrio marinus TaxID=28885 RepID=A0A066ZSP9_HYDMR|nr:hypothetical protein [Hydrogenovibrio marinus]KDN96833.1 hypothetical protein EI16_11390 [Hydrogenovibrio marinus]BBN59089.1 hypothetical protein HVMH_0683 [Hydrogenovibrio marinus]
MAEEQLDETVQIEDEAIPLKPTAEEMLERLHDVELGDLDLKQLTEEAKGNQAWLFVMTMPVSALFLVIVTLLGTFLTGYFIASFIIGATFVFLIGQMLDQYERKFKNLARIEAMKRIEAVEGEYGLLPHFNDFLPTKYRHLWQTVRRKNFIYIEQYIAAMKLLQNKLDREKFIYIWRLKHPETDPNHEPEE